VYFISTQILQQDINLKSTVLTVKFYMQFNGSFMFWNWIASYYSCSGHGSSTQELFCLCRCMKRNGKGKIYALPIMVNVLYSFI
jgi:hypothetical protein